MEWKPAADRGAHYEVSDSGLVRFAGGRELKQSTDRDGYRKVSLYRGGKPRQWLVHRLVLITFTGNPPVGHEVLHRDGNPENNRLSNLRWGTRAENIRDQVGHGTHINGGKSRCHMGHPFDSANTYFKSDGARQCRTCQRAAVARYKARKALRAS